MNMHDKAKEALRLTKEVIEEAKNSSDRQFAGIFQTFEEEFVARAELLVRWTAPK